MGKVVCTEKLNVETPSVYSQIFKSKKIKKKMNAKLRNKVANLFIK